MRNNLIEECLRYNVCCFRGNGKGHNPPPEGVYKDEELFASLYWRHVGEVDVPVLSQA